MPDATFGRFNNELGAIRPSGGQSRDRSPREWQRSPAQQAELDRIAENIGNSPYAILVVEADGRIALANSALASVFGSRPEEVVGERVEILSGLRHRAIYADEIDVELLIEDVVNAVALPDNILIESVVRVPRLRGIRTAVATSLYDLLGNAVRECTREDSRISIACNEESGHCVFAIAYCCTGRETAGSQNATSPEFPAAQRTGVGLAETRKLIEAHGGGLTVEPAIPPRGPTCRISWPLA